MTDPYREPDKDATIAALRERVAELEGKAKRPPALPRLRRALPNLLVALSFALVATAGAWMIRQRHAEHHAEMAEAERRSRVLCEAACPAEVVDMSGGWAELRCLCAAPGGGLLAVEPWEASE